ncbi:unnamed protein product [Parnassius apollo]|uniref:(apollo) hypothetical protein n=1 Tax=Parnassius apollo TaxID=110799 RepID=A0A8S3XQF4_PARAO|nr:unnamed protein product [Parnassius apollo]
MPKFKGRISDRGKWDENKMKEAVKNVMEGKLSVRQAADRFDVPRSSLHDRLKVLKSGKEVAFYPKLGRFETTFSENFSMQLYEHVKELDNRLMPLSRKEFLKLAFDLAENLKIPHRFNKEKGVAGKDFFYSFRKKYPNIVLRTPESTSIARAVGFNKPQKMDKNGRLMIGAPPDSIATPQESGWMNGEVFFQWLQHFKQHVQPTETNPVLLILDGHASHKELAVIKYARNHYIHMLSTPPHTTHKLQPLDRTFFKPFKSAFATASSAWMRRNPAARITDYDIAALVDEAFSRAARLDIAQNGFKCTGIYPFNPEIFTDIDFLPSMMTDVMQEVSSKENMANQFSVAHSSPVPSTSHALPANEPESSTSSTDILKQLSPFPDASKKTVVKAGSKNSKERDYNIITLQKRCRGKKEK